MRWSRKLARGGVFAAAALRRGSAGGSATGFVPVNSTASDVL
jgi:hypothetical protein